jgi:hypothetical protein
MKKQTLLFFMAIIQLAAVDCIPLKVNHACAAHPPVQPGAGAYSGTVAETMNAAGYTYVLLNTGKEKIWFAGPGCQVKVGDNLSLPAGMLKENFTSKTLNRTFEKIYFVDSIAPVAATAVCSVPASKAIEETTPVPMEGSSRAAAPSPAGVDFSGITKPAGGKTVAEIHAGRAALAGKAVKFRGKVVKFNADIMGKNWAHVQDGTGAAGTNDLTVTTLSTVKVGDRVLVEGVVTIDKDFGYGYKYSVVIDNATIKAE